MDRRDNFHGAHRLLSPHGPLHGQVHLHDEQQQSSPPLDFIFGRIGLNVTLKPFISIYKYLHHLLFRIALNSFNNLYVNVCSVDE